MTHNVPADRRLLGPILSPLAILTMLLAGCAGTDAAQSSGHARPPSTSASPNMDMPGMDMSQGAGPSAPARMICGAEIRGNVQRQLALDSPPRTKDSWSDQVYTCTYQLPVGSLVLSVQDASDQSSGRRYFDALRTRHSDARPLPGMDGLGLPSYQTKDGTVAFLKDGKTLRVDASALPNDLSPDHQTRSDVAYAIAAGVVACWSE